MRRMRKTKLLATLGPASEDTSVVEKLFEVGADIFRINMSHSSHDVLRARVKQLRAMEAKYNRPVGILADLQGPKLRVGTFKEGSAMLVNGQRFTLDSNPEPGDVTRVHLPHPEILEPLQVGHTVIIDDGCGCG
jgi:pyruvate kinase